VVARRERDLGAALLGSRPGPAVAGPRLAGVFGLAWRLQRGPLLAWTIGCLVLGGLAGWLASSIAALVGDDAGTRKLFDQLGGGSGGLVDSYLATSFGLLGVAASVYAVSALLRLRAEEEAGRVEPLLAGGVSRARLVVSHLAVAVGGSLVLVLAMGLTCGLARGVDTGQLGQQLGRELLAGLAQAPVPWLLAAVACLLVGLRPRWAVATWAVLAVAVVLGLLGGLLGLPRWVQDLSPYSYLPQLPASSLPVSDGWPVLGLVGLAAVVAAAGSWAYRRRDIPA
jgi:ABC-2 type transport system permease protein